jgi:hypothetical protein
MSEYPPSGVLFSNKKKTKETSPDYTGKLELSDEVINDLMDQQSRGVEKPVLSLAGWKKVANKTGETFLSLRGNKYEERGQSQNAPAPKPMDDEVPF